MTSLARTSSWIVVSKETGAAIFETFNEQLTTIINRDKYDVVPVLTYLQGLNK